MSFVNVFASYVRGTAVPTGLPFGEVPVVQFYFPEPDVRGPSGG